MKLKVLASVLYIFILLLDLYQIYVLWRKSIEKGKNRVKGVKSTPNSGFARIHTNSCSRCGQNNDLESIGKYFKYFYSTFRLVSNIICLVEKINRKGKKLSRRNKIC